MKGEKDLYRRSDHIELSVTRPRDAAMQILGFFPKLINHIQIFVSNCKCFPLIQFRRDREIKRGRERVARRNEILASQVYFYLF